MRGKSPLLLGVARAKIEVGLNGWEVGFFVKKIGRFAWGLAAVLWVMYAGTLSLDEESTRWGGF